MALRVWLPLNGNTNNYGISDITVTNNGATVDNNGKIGKCYSFNGSNSIITSFDPSSFTSNTFSLSIWFNIAALRNDYDSLCCLYKGSGGSWYDTPIWLGRWGSSTRWGIAINNASTGPISCLINTALNLNTWYNIIVTYDGIKLKIYLNGNLENTTASNLQIGYSYATQLAIGTAWGGYKFQGKLNDIRIYNYAISEKEVKELSKGLVLHYRLTGPGQANLLTNSLDLSKWDNPSGRSELQSDNFYKATYTGGGWWGPRKAINLIAGKTYIASCMARGTRAQLWFYHNVSGGNDAGSAIVNTNKATKLTVVFTPTVTGSYYVVGYAANDSNTYFYKDMKLEEGSVATPWCPNPTDSLYSTLGYNSNIEDDCSGYLYNGTKSGSITASSDTARYSSSYKFDTTSSKIKLPVLSYSGFANSYSFSWWQKNTSSGNMPWGFSDGNRLNLYHTTNLCWNTGDSGSNPFKDSSGAAIPNTRLCDSTWHHCVVTGNGSTTKLYIDGIYAGAATTYKAITGTQIYISGWDTGTSYTFSGSNLSDFRIYATALSDADIKELYNTSLSIDNVGNIYTYEFEEI